TKAVFEQAGHQTYEFLRGLGHSLPAFSRYFRAHTSAVRLAYLWSRLRRREVNCLHVLRRVSRRMGLRLEDATLRQLGWHWYAPLTLHTTVAPDVIPTLSKFRDRGLKLALVSNTFIPGYLLDRHLELHRLLEFFPTRIYSSEIG